MREVPLKIDDSFIEIKARGNGSCGPNSLAIIFCSYLFGDVYKDCSIDLVEFAHAWNLYYSEDEDQIECIKPHTLSHTPDELLNQIKEKILNKLMIDEGGSFFDCENIIAPLIRFYQLMYTKINNIDHSSQVFDIPKPPVTVSAFTGLNPSHSSLTSLIKEIKDDISNKVQVNPLNGGTDNSPSYRSMFELVAMQETARELLSLDIKWALKGGYTTRSDPFSGSLLLNYLSYKGLDEKEALSELKRTSRNSIFWFGPSSVKDSGSLLQSEHSGKFLLCVVINSKSPAHFDATIPAYLRKKSQHLADIFKNTKNHRRYDNRSDDEVYNPSHISPAPKARRNYCPSPQYQGSRPEWDYNEPLFNFEQFFSTLLPILKWSAILSAVISAFMYFPIFTLALCAFFVIAYSGQKAYQSIYNFNVRRQKPAGTRPPSSSSFGWRSPNAKKPAQGRTSSVLKEEHVSPTPTGK